MNRVNTNDTLTGNNDPAPAEFPLPSLRQFLMPDQTVKVKTFTSGNIHSGDSNLDDQINQWVYKTKNIIATVGPLAMSAGGYSISVTYVEAARDYKNV
tara:strand:- start:481 stop:774 length:294 start_codon:yes stop_codon:yes gene_type:complete